jgi:hypothetical protein
MTLIPPLRTRLLTRRALVLHALAPRQLAGDLLGAPVPALGRVAALDRRQQAGARLPLVVLARRAPRLGAREGADCALRACGGSLVSSIDLLG